MAVVMFTPNRSYRRNPLNVTPLLESCVEGQGFKIAAVYERHFNAIRLTVGKFRRKTERPFRTAIQNGDLYIWLEQVNATVETPVIIHSQDIASWQGA